VLQKFRGELQMLDSRGQGGEGQVGYSGGSQSSGGEGQGRGGSDFGQSGPGDRSGGGGFGRDLDDEIPF